MSPRNPLITKHFLAATAGAFIAARVPIMQGQRVREGHYKVDDGLGVRWVESDPAQGWMEVLEIAPSLSTHPAVERAMRAQAERHGSIHVPALAPVHRIDCERGALRVVSVMRDGVRLSDLLADLEFGNAAVSDAGALEIAGAVVR